MIQAMPTRAVIPAAGLGTRLRPLSVAIPKEMLPVGGKVALEWILDELAAAGIQHAVLVLSPAKELLIRGYFGTEFVTAYGALTIAYAIQQEMRGLGDAILCASACLPEGEPFVVALGDAVFEEPKVGGLLNRMMQATVRQNATMGVAVQEIPENNLSALSSYGVVCPVKNSENSENSENGKNSANTEGIFSFPITTIVEKPKPADAPSRFAVAARYVLPFGILQLLHETRPAEHNGEIQLTDALRPLLERGNGQAVPLQAGEVRHDLGSKESYYKAFLTFCLKDTDTKETLHPFCKRALSLSVSPEENPV